MVTVIRRGTRKKKIKEILDRHKRKKKSIDLKSYCGVINLKVDPMKIQRELRSEWQ